MTTTHEARSLDSSQHHEALFARLDASIDEIWDQASRSASWTYMLHNGFDLALYRMLMVQIYHFTRHNSINQAVAVVNTAPEQTALLRYAYNHAREELGHENMVLHDLRAIGLLDPGETITEPPISATDALINYLYGVAIRQGLIALLGYSYWADSANGHIAPLLEKARESLGLNGRQMMFFLPAAEIGSKHAVAVERAIRRSVQTQAEADAVHRVATTSLWLMVKLLEQTFERWTLTRPQP